MCIPTKKIALFFPIIYVAVWYCNFTTSSLLHGQQKYRFEHLNIEQGLSQSSINCMAQDEFGFMWFGTQDGLNKFDGYSFTVFKHEALDSNSISNSFIHSLFSDRMGFLWIGTDKGLDQFDLRTGKIKHYPFAGRVLSITGDSLFIWGGTSGNGLFKIDRQTGKWSSDQFQSKRPGLLFNKDIKSLLSDTDGSLWIGTSAGLFRLLKSGDLDTSIYSASFRLFHLNRIRINQLITDHKGRLWMGTENGLLQFDSENSRFTNTNLSVSGPVSVNALVEDNLGSIWAVSDDGLFIVSTNDGRCFQLKANPNYRNSLNSNFLSTIYQSSDKTMWIGSFNQGINKYSPHRHKFLHFEHDAHDLQSISNNDVWAFCVDDDGNLWVGTDKGLNRMNRNRDGAWLVRRFYNDPSNPQSMINDRIWSLMKDRRGNLWIGTDGGVSMISKNQVSVSVPRFKNYVHDPQLKDSPINNRITALREDRQGKIWIGTSGGLSVLDPERETFTSFRHVPGDTASLSHNRILSIFEDHLGVVWIGTSGGGLNRFNAETSTFTAFKNDPLMEFSLSNDRVTAIFQDSTGILWIGTLGGGLNRLDVSEGKFRHYTDKDGLANNAVYGIIQDKNKCLWISTNKGLSRFTLPEHNQTVLGHGHFRNYSVTDGLQSSEFNSGSYYVDKEGRIYFGGINGFNMFEPETIEDNPNTPSLAFTIVRRIGENAETTGPLPPGDHIDLSHGDQGIFLEFTALDYTVSGLNRYAYRMIGFDKDWHYSGTKHDVTYTNLDPGEYVFVVKGSNHDQVWNEAGISIRITVHPPFWNSWWFRAILVFLFLGILYATYRYRTRKIKRKNKELERLVAERTRNLEKANLDLQIANRRILQANEMKSRFLANMSHELRTPLNSIIGFSDLLIQGVLGPIPAEQQESIQAISSSSKNLLKLINDVLDISKIEAGKMVLKRSAVHLDELIHNASHMMVPLFEQKKQRFSLQLPDPSPVIPVDENKIKQVIVNILSNASKFTPIEGSIRISAQPISYNGSKKDYVEIRISDNGKGIAPEELESIFEEFRQSSDNSENQGTGLGLTLSKKIVELHGGKIWAESDGKSGSEFIVHLPLIELKESL